MRTSMVVVLMAGLVPALLALSEAPVAVARDLDGPGGAEEARRVTGCLSRLRRIGGLLAMREAMERFRIEGGPAYLLQVAEDLTDEELGVFLCPGDPAGKGGDLAKLHREDWRRAPCSYRGPDRELLDRLRREPGEELVIACDRNGPDGRTPHHAGGVCVLYSTARVAFLEWSEIEGSEGKPVAVGPNSPDPRFRHLIARDEKKNLLPRLWAEIARLRDQRVVLEERIRKLERELLKIGRRLRERAEASREARRIEAAVVGVSAPHRVLLLSAGKAEGVKVGMEFRLLVGETCLGAVTAVIVGDDHTVCVPQGEDLEREGLGHLAGLEGLLRAVSK